MTTKRRISMKVGGEAPRFAGGTQYPSLDVKKGTPAVIALLFDNEEREILSGFRHWVSKRGAGNVACLGREEILEQGGVDVENCPLCAYVNEFGGDGLVSAPKVRFGLHVFEYSVYVRDNKPQIAGPDIGTIKFFDFGLDKYNSLLDLLDREIDISAVDLAIKCTDENFKKWVFSPLDFSAYQSTSESRATVLALFQAEKHKNPEALLYKRMDRVGVEAIVTSLKVQDKKDAPPVVQRLANVDTTDIATNVPVVDLDGLFD